MKKITVEKLQNLLTEYGVKYYCVYDWNLTDEEKIKFENAEIGDDIHIETPMVPVVIDEGDGYFIGMYTDKNEIPEELIKEKTIQYESFESFLISCKASATVLKDDVRLVLNPYSRNDEKCVFSMKEIDVLYNKIADKLN